MPDFQVADSEFDRQASILDVLIELVDTSALQNPEDRIIVSGSTLPLVPQGGQNTMAAAAVVLLAAHFEEYVRQQIEEYVKVLATNYIYLDVNFKEKVVDSYWRASSSKLSRIKPKGFPAWAVLAEPILLGLIDYPVKDNIAQLSAKILSEHENNMRWETICELSGRVGVKSLSDLMHKNRPLRDILNNPKRNDISRVIQRKLNEFYDLRNGIMHSIAQNVGVGATVFRAWSDFFRVFTTAFASALSESCSLFEREVAKQRARSLPAQPPPP